MWLMEKKRVMVVGVLLPSDQIVPSVPYTSTQKNTTATMISMFLQKIQLTNYFNLDRSSYLSDLTANAVNWCMPPLNWILGLKWILNWSTVSVEEGKNDAWLIRAVIQLKIELIRLWYSSIVSSQFRSEGGKCPSWRRKSASIISFCSTFLMGTFRIGPSIWVNRSSGMPSCLNRGASCQLDRYLQTKAWNVSNSHFLLSV